MAKKAPPKRRKTDLPLRRRRRPKETGPKGFVKEFFRHIQRYMVTGLMVWVPLIVTVWVAWWVISNVGFGLERYIEQVLAYLTRLGDRIPSLRFLGFFHYTPGLGFLLAILLFLTTGFFARYLVGQRIIAYGELLVARIPFISRIYIAIQQIRDVFVSRDGTVFQEVVVIEYPRPELFAVGFVTSLEKGIVQRSMRRDLVAVFVPTTPNPTSGFLLYVPPDDLTRLDISVEDAMKLIISGGAFLPGRVEEVAQLAAERKEEKKALQERDRRQSGKKRKK